MRESLKKGIACLCLATVMFSLCSCMDGCSGGTDSSGGSNIPAEAELTEHKVTNGLHLGVENVADTGIPFIVNKKTEYKIVIGTENASLRSSVVKAAGFISSQINNATGVTLEIVDDDENVQWNTSAKYIVIGSEKLEKASGFIETKEDIGITGYQIKTIGNSAFIHANGYDGFNLGALAILRVLIGYDCLSADMFIYTKGGEYLPAMDIVERPDFDYRLDQTLYQNSIAMEYPMGFTHAASAYLTEGDPVHTSFDFLPPSKYEKDNPNWYSNQRCNFADDTENYLKNAAQLCYTAHGSKEDLKKMQELIAERVVWLTLEKFPERHVCVVGQQDDDQVCNCDNCKAVLEEYGSIAAAIIPFINGVDDIVQTKLKQYAEEHNQPIKETNILFLSYQSTRFAPKYDDSLKLNEHVGVLIASSKTRYAYTFYDSINSVDKEQIENWQPFGDVYYFFYEINSNNYFVPCNTFRAVAENYRFAKQNNGRLMTSMGNWKTLYTSGFTAFKTYLNARLWFNVNYEYGDLEKTFFDNYYGEGGEYMKKFFDEMTSYMTYMRDQGDINFNGVVVNEVTYTAKYWPIQMLRRWNNYCDQALKAIEKTKVLNDGTYETLRDHIVIDSMFPRYIICKFHGEKYSESEIFEMRKAFYKDTLAYNMTHEGQYNTFEKLWEAWGVA